MYLQINYSKQQDLSKEYTFVTLKDKYMYVLKIVNNEKYTHTQIVSWKRSDAWKELSYQSGFETGSVFITNHNLPSSVVDPDLHPEPDPPISSKNIEKNLLISTVLWLLYDFLPVFRIRIRTISMFLGLPDPHLNPLDRGMDPKIRIRTNMSRIHNTADQAKKFQIRPDSQHGTVCEWYLEGLLLVEVVVALHVLGLAVRLRLDDTLHVRRPPEPTIKSYINYSLESTRRKGKEENADPNPGSQLVAVLPDSSRWIKRTCTPFCWKIKENWSRHQKINCWKDKTWCNEVMRGYGELAHALRELYA